MSVPPSTSPLPPARGARWRWAALGLGLAVAIRAADMGTLLTAPPTIYFPPGVPVFGERIADTVPIGRERGVLPPPEGLGAYVNEAFYPPLATRLRENTLGARIEERVEAFQARRATLINELADQLVALHGMAEPGRTDELRAFAEQQSPRIVTLEREAEELRQALVNGGVLRLSVDWSRHRPWVLRETRFATEYHEREAQFQVVRAAAYYQDGLLPEQRRLLLEVAFELRSRARMARPVPVPRREDASAMFFSPATSRLRLPKVIPEELVEKLGRYNRDKTALKQDLYEAVVLHDRSPRGERTRAFEQLADRHWPLLGELEKLAEEIRVDLAALPRERLVSPPYVPASLMEEIRSYQSDRQKFIDEFDQAMRVATNLVTPPAADRSMTQDERVQQMRRLAAQRAELRATVAAAFHEQTKERFEAMRKRYDAIQANLALVAAGQFDPENGRPLTAETLLRSHSAAMDRFDTFGREEVIYRGYRTAMLMPGLSPEQRRLLFGAAIVSLAQPLPWGELAPSEAQPVPRS